MPQSPSPLSVPIVEGHQFTMATDIRRFITEPTRPVVAKIQAAGPTTSPTTSQTASQTPSPIPPREPSSPADSLVVAAPSMPQVAQPIQPAQPAQVQTQRRWDALCSHLNEWFYKPDLQALAITMAACAAQFNPQAEPVWLFVLGPSGSGKTSVIINSLSAIPSSHVLGSLTGKTLLSGFTGTKHASLLHQIGSGIMLFKDFTTFLSLHPIERATIASQLREVFDGSYTRSTGKVNVAWKGKMTVIAACTPALERYWALNREFGERFLQVRLAAHDREQMAEYADKQRDNSAHIRDKMAILAEQFFTGHPTIQYPAPILTKEQRLKLAKVAELALIMRGRVHRTDHGNREIMFEAEFEDISRIAAGLGSIACYHAALFRRSRVEPIDMAAAGRVASDTIPSTRAKLAFSLPHDGTAIGTLDLMEISGLNASTLRWVADELAHLGILTCRKDEVSENEYALTPTAVAMLRFATWAE